MSSYFLLASMEIPQTQASFPGGLGRVERILFHFDELGARLVSDTLLVVRYDTHCGNSSRWTAGNAIYSVQKQNKIFM